MGRNWLSILFTIMLPFCSNWDSDTRVAHLVFKGSLVLHTRLYGNLAMQSGL